MAGNSGLEFHWADYVVFVAMLSASAAIGIFYAVKSRKNNTTSEFMLASRTMGFFPVAMSLLASLFTGIYIQGGVAETYARGALLLFGSIVPLVFAGAVSGRIFMPKFYELNLTSLYQYLDMRFNVAVRCCCLVLGYLYMILHSGIATLAASLVLSTVTNSKLSLLSSAVILSAVCTFYTVFGGIKAVLWADCFQMFLIFSSLLAAIFHGIAQLGAAEIWRINVEGGRFDILNFNLDPTIYASFWTVFIGTFFSWLPSLTVLQYQMQRYVTCRSQRTADVSFGLFIAGCVVVTLLCMFTGMTIYAVYEGCDPLTTGVLASADGLLPFFVLVAFQKLPGVPGLLISGLCSAALSTTSSILNSIATITSEHIITKVWPDWPDSRYLLGTKLLALMFGCLNVGTTVLVASLGALLPAVIGLIGVTNGPVFGVFFLGLVCPRANTKGTMVGFFVGFIAGLWIFIGSVIHQPPVPSLPLSIEDCVDMSDIVFENVSQIMTTAATGTLASSEGAAQSSTFSLYLISRLWYPTICILLVVIVGYIASLIFDTIDGKPEAVDPALLWNWRKSCCCCVYENPQLELDDKNSLFARHNEVLVSDPVKADTIDEKRGENGLDNPVCDDDVSYTTHL